MVEREVKMISVFSVKSSEHAETQKKKIKEHKQVTHYYCQFDSRPPTEETPSWVWWHIPVILELQRLRQEDLVSSSPAWMTYPVSKN